MSEIETASDASVKSGTSHTSDVSEVVTASDDHSRLVEHDGRRSQVSSVETAVDTSDRRSPLSSVHTSPSLQQHQPAVRTQPHQLSLADMRQGLSCYLLKVQFRSGINVGLLHFLASIDKAYLII